MAASYKYVSDNGTTYQAVLSDEFATPLAYVAASGSEAYLPAYISPRYVSLQHATLPLVASAFVTSPANLATFPKQISNSEGLWNVLGFVGEQRLPQPQGTNLVVAAGVQGQKGDTGAQGIPGIAAYYHTALASNLSLTTTQQDFYTQAVAAGTYLALATLVLSNGTTAANVLTAEMKVNGIVQNFPRIRAVAASVDYWGTFADLFTFASAGTFSMSAAISAGTGALLLGVSGQSYTNVTLLKLA
jgi:hypothetical protein